MGGGSPRRMGAAAPAPGSCERGRMLSPPWGGGGSYAKERPEAWRGWLPKPGHLRSVRATLRSGKQDSVPGQFVHLGQSWRRKRPLGYGMLTSVGSLSGFARNWEGWGSQKWACQRDKPEGERPGPNGKNRRGAEE